MNTFANEQLSIKKKNNYQDRFSKNLRVAGKKKQPDFLNI